MNKITEVGIEASQSFAELESPARHLFVKGIAGLGATLSSSSLLCSGTSAQGKARQAAAPGNEVPAAQVALTTFHPVAYYMSRNMRNATETVYLRHNAPEEIRFMHPSQRKMLSLFLAVGGSTLLLGGLGAQARKLSPSDRLYVGFVGIGNYGTTRQMGSFCLSQSR